MAKVNLTAVIGMLERAYRFDEMPSPQQAALRAQVTRTLKTATDPDILDVLGQIQDVIGVSAPKSADRMTAGDLVEEYEGNFDVYSPRQKAAFKAKVSRLSNIAASDGDDETVAAMSELTDRITREEEADQRRTIRELVSQLRKG